MKSKILNRLRGAEEFVSGQQLCEEFGVSERQYGKQSISLKKKAMRSRRYTIGVSPFRMSDIISVEEVKADFTGLGGL